MSAVAAGAAAAVVAAEGGGRGGEREEERPWLSGRWRRLKTSGYCRTSWRPPR